MQPAKSTGQALYGSPTKELKITNSRLSGGCFFFARQENRLILRLSSFKGYIIVVPAVPAENKTAPHTFNTVH